jgi:hypothetical protein
MDEISHSQWADAHADRGYVPADFDAFQMQKSGHAPERDENRRWSALSKLRVLELF